MKYNFRKINDGTNDLPVILLLHGWGGSLQSLTFLQEELGKSIPHTIINLELPGFGDTEVFHTDMKMSDYAEFVSKFVEDQKISTFIAVGHSFGGKILLEMLTGNYRLKPSKIVLINNSGIRNGRRIKARIFKIISKLIPKKFKNFSIAKSFIYKYILRERDYLNAGQQMKKILANVLDENYDKKVNTIDLPTLIIWGENDSYVPLWMGRKLHKLISNSKFVVVPNATHGLPIKEPKIVAEIISKWLSADTFEE